MNDTIVEAIAQSSPSGRMSKRARKAAQERLRAELFRGMDISPKVKQPAECEALLRQASELEDLAERGMSPRKNRREAARLRQLAERRT